MTITAIILTEAQVGTVHGVYNGIAELQPVPIGNGRFFLPLAVLNDSNFAEVHEILSGFPIEEIILIESKPEV